MKSRKLFMETVSFVEFLSHNKDLFFFTQFVILFENIQLIFLLSTTLGIERPKGRTKSFA